MNNNIKLENLSYSYCHSQQETNFFNFNNTWIACCTSTLFSLPIQLQAEKEKAAAKMDGLESEIDGLKGRLRNLQHKAEREVREWSMKFKQEETA